MAEHGLLERELELGALTDAVDAALAGKASALLLEGPPGTGKTALLKRGRRVADARGLRVVGARGAELERDFPFGVARQLVAPLAGEHPDLLRGPGRRVARLLDDEQLEPEEAHGAAWALVRFFMRAAEAEPFLICVDDAHWSDALSLELLALLARDLEDAAISLVVAARPTEPGAPLALHDLASAPTVRRLSIGALSTEAVADLVRARVPAASRELCAACAEAAGGNAFLTHALVDELCADHLVDDEAAATRVAALAPSTVVATTTARIGRLGSDAAALAQAVAIVERDVGLAVTATLAELDLQAALLAADALRAASILEGESDLAFVHPLLRVAVYDGIAPGRREQLHAAAARELRAAGYPAERVAGHLLLTTPSGNADASRILRDVAARAIARGAPRAAVGLLARARAEQPPDPERHDLDVELALARYHAREDVTAVMNELVAAVRSAPDTKRLVEAAISVAHPGIEACQATKVGELLNDVLERLGHDDAEPRHRVQTALLEAAVNDGELLAHSGPLIDELIAGLRSETAVERRLLRGVACAVALRGGSAATVEAVIERAGGLDGLDMPAAFRCAWALAYVDRHEAAARLADDLVAGARREGDLPLLHNVLVLRGTLLFGHGDLRSAEADLIEAIELGDPLTLDAGRAMLAQVLASAGRLDEATRIADRVDLTQLPQTMVVRVQAECSLAHAHLETGRLDQAIAVLRSVEQRWRRCRVTMIGPEAWRSDLARALARQGHHDQARTLAEEEAEIARRVGSAGAEGKARLAAALSTHSPDPAELEHAVALSRDGRRGLVLAEALLAFGAALRRQRQRTAAREPLAEAVDLAVRLGAHGIAERALVELRAAGARPRRELRTGVDALTPSELRIARLAAAGHSNPQISQELFVTRKTVETHMTRILQKLDLTSRTELTAALATGA